MRIRTPFLRTSAAIAALPLLLAASLSAQLNWSAPIVGPDRDGDWDTVTNNWDPAPAQNPGTQPWVNGPATAVFNNAEDGMVIVTAPITAGGIAAGMGGTYTISGGMITGFGLSLDVNVDNASPLNIESILVADVTKMGPGTLGLTGATAGGLTTQGGLVILSGNNIDDGSEVDVQAGSTLQLDGDDTVSKLTIDGTLGGIGTLTATAALDGYSLLGGAVIDGNLGEGTFFKADGGIVTINGTVASDVVEVPDGTLILSGDNLEDTAALSTMGNGILQLNGTETVGSYSQGGGPNTELGGAGTLTAAMGSTLSGGTISGNLLGDVTTDGPVTVAPTGSLGGGSLMVDAGILTLDSPDGSVTSTPVTIAGPGTLVVNDAGLDGAVAVTNDGNFNVFNAAETVATYESNGGTLGGNNTLTTTGGAILNDGSTVDSVLLGTTQTNGTVGIAGIVDGGTLTVNNGTLNVTGKVFSDTAVLDGTVNLNGAPGSMNGPLVVGDGVGGPASAQVVSLMPSQFGGPTTQVTVNSDGKLTAFSDTIVSLDVIGGVVDTGVVGSGLSVLGAVVLEGGAIEGVGPFATGSGLVTVNPSANSFTISAPLDLGPATTLDVADGPAADDLVVSGVVSGGSLFFVGAGTLVLNNPLNAQAGTSIDGGTLTIGATGASGGGPITVLGSTINYADGVNELNPVNLLADVDLNVDALASATQTGVISGAFGIDKVGDGSLELAGANTYTGATDVSAGTLVLTGSLTSTTLGISAGASFDNQSGGLAAGTDVTNAGTLNVDSDNTVNSYLSNGGLLSGGATLTATNGATLNDGSSVTGNLSGDTATSGTVSISGTATGGMLDVNGGLTTISGAFDYPVININTGQLSLTGPADTTTQTAVNVAAGTTFDNTAADGIDFGFGGAGALVGSGGTISGAGLSLFDTVSLNGDTLSGNVAGSTAALNDGTAVSGNLVSGAITTNGNVSVTGLLGDGTLTRGGTNITIGPGGTTTVATGTLTLSGAGQLTSQNLGISGPATLDNQNGGIIDTAAVTNAGILDVDADDTVDSYVSNGGLLSGMATLTATNGATLNGGSSVSGKLSGDTTSDGAVNVSGTIGGGSLAVNSGVLTLDGTSTNNPVSINNGAQLVDNGDLGDTAAVTNNEGTLTVNTVDMVGSYTSGGGAGTALLDGTGTLSAASYDLNDKSTIAGNLGNGPVSAEGSVMITATGTTGTGPFTVLNGLTSNAGNIGGNAVVNGGTLDNDGTVTGSVENNSNFNNNAAGMVVTNLDNNATATNAGTIFGNLDNSGGLTNTGMVLGMTVNSGNLMNTGAGILTGDVTNNAGGVLTTDADGIGDTADLENNAGTVTLNGDDTIASYTSNGGLLQGPGKLSAASYDLNDGSTVDGHLGTGTLNANGTVSYSGTSMADTVNIRSGVTSLTGAGQFGMDTSLFDISGGARLNLGGADYRFTTIQGGGTVGGNLLIGGGDSIYPGTMGAVGTLTVDGDLTVMGTPGDAANVGIDVFGAGPGGFDVISVSGNFLLGSDSNLEVSNPGGIGTLPAPIKIVDFATQAGNFTSTNLLGAFTTLHVYNPAAGTIQPLNLGATGEKSSYLIGNLNENQSAGYRALFEDVVDAGFQNVLQVFYDGTTDLPLAPGVAPGYEDYFRLELNPAGAYIQDGDPQLRMALNATPLPGGGLSGAIVNLLLPEVHQGMADFTEQSMRGLVRLATRTAPVAKAGKAKVFAAVHSSTAGSTDSTTNASYDIDLAGVVTGARYEVAPGFQIGALLGYDDGSIEGPLVDTDGMGYVLGLFGEYVVHEPSQTTVFASLSYGDYEYDAARTSFGGLATANGIGADALEFAVGIRGVGYENENFRLLPSAMLRYMSGEVDGFTENGPGVPLWVTGYDFDSLLLEVGVDAEFEVNEVVTVVGHIGFQTDFSDSGNSIGASFVNGMAPFTVRAPGVDDEAFVFGAGAYFDVTETVQLGLNWRSELRDSSQSVHSIGLGASFGF